MENRGKVIIVCGLIGSGKSTLSRELAETLGPNTLWLSEPDEKSGRNPYLADYYKDPARWAFTMQVHLLGLRYKMHLQAQWYAMNTGNSAVMDSSYWQDTAFARLQLANGLMSKWEFETYATMYQSMTASVLLPTMCLRTLVSPETSLQRISSRMTKELGRKCETAVSMDYLQGLDKEIDRMVSILKQQGVGVLEIPWDVDRDSPESRRSAVEELADSILNYETSDLFLDHHRRVIS
jgi:deoxyadenosine kinase